MTDSIAYLVSCEEDNYTHEYVDDIYLDLDEAIDAFYEIVRLCKSEGDECTTDYVSIEQLTATIQDGDVIDLGCDNQVIKEHTFNEPE